MSVAGVQQTIAQLIEGVYDYLNKPPFVEQRDCRASEKYAWLLSSATHAVEKLMEARNSITCSDSSLSIMLMVPALRYWHDNSFNEYKDNLKTLVPSCPELNDAPYWASIKQARFAKMVKTGETLTGDWSVSWHDHFWAFDVFVQALS